MTRSPGTKNSHTTPHRSGRPNSFMYDEAHLRHEFLKDIRSMKEPLQVMDIADRRDRCGLYPTCKREAVERRIYWDAVHEYTIVDLCAEELKELGNVVK